MRDSPYLKVGILYFIAIWGARFVIDSMLGIRDAKDNRRDFLLCFEGPQQVFRDARFALFEGLDSGF